MTREELGAIVAAGPLGYADVRVLVRLASGHLLELDVLRAFVRTLEKVQLDEYAEPAALADPPLGYAARALVLEVEEERRPAEVNASVVVAER